MNKEPGSTNIMVSLDLELNKEGQQTTDIIQIGYCVFDCVTGTILDKGCLDVNSGKTLNPFIINLTGITQEQHDKGEPLAEAYSQLKAVCLRHNAMRMITWGMGDHETLKRQLNIEYPEWIFGRGYWDTKKIYQAYRMANQLTIQSGLSKSMSKVGLQFQGRKHNAEADSFNTMKMFIKMLELLKEKK
jgi:inhibitor of KinA sporulation pathway (predicted exonuclease)